VNLPGSILENLARVAATHPEIRAVYLFGSQVKGDARPDSDLDVGVLFEAPQLLGHALALETELQQAAGSEVDVVDAGRAAAFLALEIVRGERIFCRDPVETDRFELYVLRRAGDLLPFERQRQALLGVAPA
jgi:predicted nucleotidyltransferase